MVGAKQLSSPMVTGRKLLSQDGSLLSNPGEYRIIIGALQYCTSTRSDISYDVSQLYQLSIIHTKDIGQLLNTFFDI